MDSKLNRSDFKGWRYVNIINLRAARKVIKEYPHLEKYPEFQEKNNKKMRLSLDKVIRYAFIMYSDTVLNQTIPELAKRKREAAILAGFTPNEETGKFAGDIESMLLCENYEINKIFVRVIMLTRNNKIQQLGVLNEARHKEMIKLMNGDGKTKDQFQNLKDMSDYIEDLEKDVLNNDNSYDLLEELYSELDSENLGIRPEEIAKAKKDGSFDKIIKSPYK